jgi:hypothetical protein
MSLVISREGSPRNQLEVAPYSPPYRSWSGNLQHAQAGFTPPGTTREAGLPYSVDSRPVPRNRAADRLRGKAIVRSEIPAHDTAMP